MTQDIDKFSGLREAVAHLEAAAAILRENTPNGFDLHVREIVQDGRPIVETLKVSVLTIPEEAKAFGSAPGSGTTHLWREVWSRPVA